MIVRAAAGAASNFTADAVAARAASDSVTFPNSSTTRICRSRSVVAVLSRPSHMAATRDVRALPSFASRARSSASCSPSTFGGV